jgi:TolB-like protein/Tfp pilus assembly protein PilF
VRRNPTSALLAASLIALAAAIGWNVWQGALISPPSALATNGIAVLPFENLSGNPDNAYFADGIQEEMLTRLGSIADLKVISRTSTQRYQSKPRNLREIAKQLGVAHILEGSVQKAADQVRVNVQLINAQTDSHLWADTYDRKLTDLFAVETEIATKIADTLQAKLTGSEKQAIAARPTENSEAHELYLRGRFYWNKGLGPEFDKSRQYYQQAVELDPNYALAYVGLADFYGFAFAVGLLPPEEKWAKMEEYMANKALELDPTLGEAYNPLAAAKLYYHRDWPAAERDFRRGLELSPNFAEMHAHYSICLLLFSRNQEAFAEMQRALNPDPLSPRFGFWLGWLHFFTRQYDAALKQFGKTLELDSNLPILHEYLGYTYEKKQMHREAIAEWSKGLRLIGADEDASLLERTYTESGFDAALRALAQKRLETFKEKTGRGEYVPAHEYVVAYMRLDDKEQAFAWLAKAFAERNRFAFEITVNPIFDSLRSDPRFKNIVASFAPKGN